MAPRGKTYAGLKARQKTQRSKNCPIKIHWQAARRNKTKLQQLRYMHIPRGQQKAMFLKIQHLLTFSLGSAAVCIAQLFQCLTTAKMKRDDNILFISSIIGTLLEETISEFGAKEHTCDLWATCKAGVGVQRLPLEIDGSARDRLDYDQNAAADISTYAGWIIKNTSDPLSGNKLLLLLHPCLQ